MICLLIQLPWAKTRRSFPQQAGRVLQAHERQAERDTERSGTQAAQHEAQRKIERAVGQGGARVVKDAAQTPQQIKRNLQHAMLLRKAKKTTNTAETAAESPPAQAGGLSPFDARRVQLVRAKQKYTVSRQSARLQISSYKGCNALKTQKELAGKRYYHMHSLQRISDMQPVSNGTRTQQTYEKSGSSPKKQPFDRAKQSHPISRIQSSQSQNCASVAADVSRNVKRRSFRVETLRRLQAGIFSPEKTERAQQMIETKRKYYIQKIHGQKRQNCKTDSITSLENSMPTGATLQKAKEKALDDVSKLYRTGGIQPVARIGKDTPKQDNRQQPMRHIYQRDATQRTMRIGGKDVPIREKRLEVRKKPPRPALRMPPEAQRFSKGTAVVKHQKAQAAKRAVQKEAARKAAIAARTTTSMLKKASVAMGRAVMALVKGLVALLGGSGLLLVIVVVAVIACSVLNSPFGILASGETNEPGTVAISSIATELNFAHAKEIEHIIETKRHDRLVMHGDKAEWTDVLAVFAVKTALADGENAADVVVIDEARAERLRTVFWDMNLIRSRVVIEDEIVVLHIYIDGMDADQAADFYNFDKQHKEALTELLTYREMLQKLLSDVAVDDDTAQDVIENLPTNLSEARRATVEHALSLVGKVHYFWGGKSSAIGWDSRWGTVTKVTAAGSPTTGTYRPYGLDCSGFVDWIFNNTMGYVIGHGGGVRMQHKYCTDIAWSEAQPGDLAFFPDNSHIGIIVARNADGSLMVCHCSSGKNNVVITEARATGFTTIGRPNIYLE